MLLTELLPSGLPQAIAQNTPSLRRTKNLLLVLAGAWMTYFVAVYWFAHSLSKIAIPLLEIPLDTYLTVQGAAIVFAVALFRFARTAE